MKYTLGIDVGSGFTKAVIFDGSDMISHTILPSGSDWRESARKAAELSLQKAELSPGDLFHSAATGYGAPMVDFCDKSVTDISCHGAAIHRRFPAARTIIDVGAQFSKVIRLNEAGRITNFVLNEKCAGGSGKFLQVAARILRIGIEEIGELSLRSTHPVEFTTGCAVFAESEAVSRIAEGAPPADILAGLHKAMASKIGNLATRLGLSPDFALTGGGGCDKGLSRAIEDELNVNLFIPEHPQITAALGAALLAFDET